MSFHISGHVDNFKLPLLRVSAEVESKAQIYWIKLVSCGLNQIYQTKSIEQMYQTKAIQSNLQNLIKQTKSTKQNLEKQNLHKIEVKSNPSWAELGPVQPQLVLNFFYPNVFDPKFFGQDFFGLNFFEWKQQ